MLDGFWSLSPRSRMCCELVLRVALAIVIMQWAHSTFINDVNLYFHRAQHLGVHSLPYRDFLWEYPPLAALPLLLVPVAGHDVNVFRFLFIAVMIGLEYGSLTYLRRRLDDERRITLFWTISVVPLGAIAYFRLDFIAMTCATFAVMGLVQGRRYIGSTIAGFAAKLWPLVFVGPMLVQRKYRDAALAVLGCLAVTAAWYTYSPHGFHEFLDYRKGSGFQIESIPGALLLLSGRHSQLLYGALVVSDSGWHWLQAVMNSLFVGVPVMAFGYAWLRRERTDLVALSGFTVTVMLLSQRLLSPQFLVWLAPFLVCVMARSRRPLIPYVVAAWITVVMIQFYTPYQRGNDIVDALGVIRDGLLVWCSIELLRLSFWQRQPAGLLAEEAAAQS